MSLGAKRCTCGSEIFARRSENSCADDKQVAQVVVDLGHREPERGEMVLLLQQRGEIELHGGELALGGADLVGAVRRRDDAGGILRLGAERHHVGGHAPHRPHQQEVQREVDQRGGDRGDDQRQDQDADGKIHHRLAQRRLVQHDLDELAAHGRRPHHPHDVAVGAHERVEGIDDGAVPGHVAHVDVVIDRRRHVRRPRAGGAAGPSSGRPRARRCCPGSGARPCRAPCRSARSRTPAPRYRRRRAGRAAS